MRYALLLAALLAAGCTNHMPPAADTTTTTSQTSTVTFHINGTDGWWTFPGEPPIYANTGFPNADIVRTVTGAQSIGFVPGQAQFSPDTVDWTNATPGTGTAHWATVTGTGSAFTVTVTPVPSGSG